MIRRTYTLYLDSRSKVGFVLPFNHCEGKNSGKPDEGGGMLLRNTETASQLHMTSVNKQQ